MNKIKLFVLLIIVFLVGASSTRAYGSAPAVTSFVASPQSVSYGHTTLLSWTIDNAAGANLYFTCLFGVSIKKDDGSTFPCNTKQAVGNSSSDSATFSIANFTGNPIVIPVKLTPTDSSGTNYDASAVSTNLFVSAVPSPITDVSYATSTTATSTTPITITWVGLEVPGVNLQFDCKDGVQIYSTSPSLAQPIACGATAYATDLPTSGSVSVYYVNTNSYSVDESVRVNPSIALGTYDATHGKTVTFTIPAKAVASIPSISGFTSSQNLFASGQSVTLSWVGSNTPGVNFQMPCSSNVTWTSSIASTTTALLCDRPAFANAQPAMGTVTISFMNTSTGAQPVPVSIYPQNFDGTYDATKARVINLLVLEPGHVEAITQTTQVSNSGTSVSVTGQTNSASGLKAVHTITFSTNLRLGSRGAQVSALQTFLKQDRTLYPEGLVTGYMGPASIAAVKRLQVRYGVAKQGDAGYGEIGPKTRLKLNSMQTF